MNFDPNLMFASSESSFQQVGESVEQTHFSHRVAKATCASLARARAPSTLLSSRCSVKYPTPNAIANPGAEVNLRQVRVPKLRSDESPPSVLGVPERHGRSPVPSLPLHANRS
ncbi:hypothetical protein ACS0PU_003535 [Formica fusca]